jgi:hypothetical protein
MDEEDGTVVEADKGPPMLWNGRIVILVILSFDKLP